MSTEGARSTTVIRVIDFETTGFELPKAEVCEVGICDLHLEQMSIQSAMTWMCRVQEMPPEARAVHHIAFAECDAWDPFDPARLFVTPCNAIAAHNAAFETQFFAPPVPVICTYKAALRVWPDAPGHSNGTLRYWLEDQDKISPAHALTQPAHRAGPDAYVTAHILAALFRTGVTGREMVAWTKEPALLPRCTIGQFRGKLWSEVDGGFLGWMVRQPTMEADLKWNAQREIDRRAKGNAP